jgi:streptogramin lyase
LLVPITLLALMRREMVVPKQPPVTLLIVLPTLAATGAFREFSLPHSNSEVMRPAIDHHEWVWYGAMGQNALVVFDPHTQTFRYLTPPHGHHGIMGVQFAPEDTIWFAEQVANYRGHSFSTTGRHQLYPLPWLTIADPIHAGQTLSRPRASNELALDEHGDVWFTNSTPTAWEGSIQGAATCGTIHFRPHRVCRPSTPMV